MGQENKTNTMVEFGLLGLLALLWGSSYFLIKVAVTEIPPLTLIAYRVTVGAMFLAVVFFWRKEKLPRDINTLARLLLQSFLNCFGAWVVLAWGQQHIESSLASVLNSTSPIFVFFITLLVTKHEQVNGLKLTGALLGLAGVVMIVGVDALAGITSQTLGALAALTGALMYACAMIHGKRFNHLPSATIAMSTMLWAVIILVPVSFIFEDPWSISPSLKAIAAATTLAVFSTGLALLIYFRLIKTLGSMNIASQAYLRSCIGVLLGVIFLGEHITPIMGLGIIAAILGVALINMPARKS